MSSEEEDSGRGSDWSSEESFGSNDNALIEGDEDVVDEPETNESTELAKASTTPLRRESRRGEASGPPLRLAGRPRKSSFSTNNQDQSARAYADALRTTRSASGSHRASISIAAGVGAAGGHLSDDTRRRHRESKKRMEYAQHMQQLLHRALELDEEVEDAPLWLHSSIIPPRWRIQIMDVLQPVHEQMSFCRERVVHASRLLLPPFDRANLHEFEKRLRYFDKSVSNLAEALTQCQQQVARGEREAACLYMQSWYRRQLARRGFYTKSLQLSRRHRGLIPGMFDTIAGTSKLVVDKRTQDVHLKYPTSPTNAKYAFQT